MKIEHAVEKVWRGLEDVPGVNAVPAVWREKLGAPFEVFRRAFLQPRSEPAQFFPCRRCGCAHEVTVFAPDDIIAVCTCEPWNCSHLRLTAEEVQILELNFTKLGRSLCQALGCDSRAADLGLNNNTRQIGSWGAEPVPIILTIQSERSGLRNAIHALANRLRSRATA